MFMRGRMESRRSPESRKRKDSTHYKVDAVVNDNSKLFAEELAAVLNARSEEGYVVVNILLRNPDNGLVVVHQKHEKLEFEPALGEPQEQGRN